MEMTRNNDYTSRNFLDYFYHQINFVGKLEVDDCASMFFVSEKQQKTIVNFSLDSLIAT